MSNAKNWSEEVSSKEDYHTPEGIFTKSSTEIVRTLMQGANGYPELALRRLVFYMNRAGTNLKNIKELEKAKAIIEEKIESNADSC